MKRILWLAAVVTMTGVAIPAAFGQNAIGYMRTAASDGTVVDTANSFNPNGGAITATRNGVGDFNVSFAGTGFSGSIELVAALGPDAEYCKVQTSGPTASAYTARIRCFDAAGNPTETRYSYTLLRPNNPQQIAFAFVSAGATVNAQYSWSPGGAITASAQGTGLYRIVFPGIATPDHVQVTAYGSDNAHCFVTFWGPNSFVNIQCVNGAGAPVNSSFDVAYVRGANQAGLGFMNGFGLDPNAGSYTPPSTYRYNSSGGAVTVTRTGTGLYSVRFAGINPSPAAGGSGPNAQAVGYAGQGNVTALRCSVDTINPEGADIVVNLFCFNAAGAPANGIFNVLLIPPQQGSGGGPVTTTITTSPEGLQVTVDGTTGTSPRQFTWAAGSSHIVSVSSPQSLGGSTNTQYVLSSWSAGGCSGSETNCSITAPATSTTITASFQTQHRLTIGLNGPGSVSVLSPPQSYPFYASGSTARIQATANTGATFTGWSGGVSGTQNPLDVTMSGPISVTGNFSGQTSCSYSLSQTSATVPAAGGTVNVSVNTTASCPWQVTNSSSFVTASVQGGTGPLTVTLTALANPSAQARNTTLTIAGQSFSVLQNGVSVTPTTSGPMRFVPLEPCRILETRPEYNIFPTRIAPFGPPFLNGNETRTLPLPASVCPVPASARAYVLTVTLIPRGQGVDFVTVYPNGESRPEFFTVRSPDGLTVANSAIVRAGTNNAIDVYSTTNTDMVIDISGYFTDNPQQSNLVFYPLTPCRVVDTRILYRQPAGPFGPPTMNAQESRSYRFPVSPCPVPAGAAAYSVTITVDPNGGRLDFLTAWPTGRARPAVSSMNSPAGRILANSVIVPASADGSMDVFTFNSTDFIVDINGYFAPDDGVNGLYFYAVGQCRAADTSNGTYTGSFGPPLIESETVRTMPIPSAPRCSGISNNARAFAVNTTIVPNGSSVPFLTLYPTGQLRPNASVINAFQGQTVSSAAIIPAGPNGSIDIFAFRRTHTIVEISGFFGRQP